MFQYRTFKEARAVFREIVIKDVYHLESLRQHTVNVIVDIGANLGIFSMYARILFPQARIIAVEPDAENFSFLQKNLKGLNVELHNMALGDGSKVSTKNREGEKAGHSRVTVEGDDIPSSRLSGMFTQWKVDPRNNTVIKIDCEGAESFIYQHPESEDILQLCKQWAMEIHYGDEWPETFSIEEWNMWLDEQSDNYEFRSLTTKHGLGMVVKRNY